MPKLSTDEFLDYLRRSDLVPHKQLDEAIANIRKEKSTERIKDPDFVALELVNQGLITNWHVRQLMKRKYKGFYLRQYRILGHLGAGGMSTVYLAEHTVMHRRVAIKVLPKKKLVNSAYLVHFVQEAQATATLDHPNIVRAYDIDQLDDIHYIVMEYFEGDNLKQLVEKEGPLAYEDAVVYIRQAALGLVHAHRVGIIHRDIKPENLLVNDLGVLKILDLGLAMLDETTLPQMMQSSVDEGKILGTADYLAPEQAINSSKVDARADIYSLGATLYFCLTGHPPFPFGTIVQRLKAHRKETPASIFKDRPDAPDDLVRICAHMMEKKPDDRFRSAAEVVRVFERWLIHHGMAEETDFPESNAEGSDLFSKSNLDSTPILNLDQYGNVTGIADYENVVNPYSHEQTVANVLDSGLRERVNLLGPQATSLEERIYSGSYDPSASDDSNFHDEYLLSRASSILRVNKEHDVLDMAMQDLSTGTVQLQKASAVFEPLATVKTQPVKQPEDEVNSVIKEVRRTLRWYRQVPVWFWAVFAAGYILATFLAGILFALLLNLNTH